MPHAFLLLVKRHTGSWLTLWICLFFYVLFTITMIIHGIASVNTCSLSIQGCGWESFFFLIKAMLAAALAQVCAIALVFLGRRKLTDAYKKGVWVLNAIPAFCLLLCLLVLNGVVKLH